MKPIFCRVAPPIPRRCCCAKTWATIAVLTLNRPQIRNTLSEAMLAALGDELAALARTARSAPWCWPQRDRHSRAVTTSRN